MPEQMWVEITQKQGVTAIVCPAAKRDQAGITLILAHGAGAGQTSGFMTRFATELSARGITVVTFNFLYAELGRRIPDRNNILESCFRAVIEVVRKRIGTGKLMIGAESMGGRIASQIVAAGAANVAGLVFVEYPLHPLGKVDEFLRGICRTFRLLCCSFKVRVTRSAQLTSCGRSSRRSNVKVLT